MSICFVIFIFDIFNSLFFHSLFFFAFLAGYQAIYVHFSYPSKNKKFNEIQNQLGLKKTSLVQLSETRWACRFKSCSSVIQNYGVLIQSLKEEIDAQKNKDVAEAIGFDLLKNIELILFCFRKFYKLFIYYQTIYNQNQLTLGNSKSLITGVITTLQEHRDSEQHYTTLWNGMLEFSTKYGIPLEIALQSVPKKRLRKEP
ncbi:zinc finger MYM-type protein 1-like, partial [Aphis craccivora]